MITLYDKKGKTTIVQYSVDARELVATGDWFREDPTAKKEDKKEDKKEVKKGDSFFSKAREDIEKKSDKE